MLYRIVRIQKLGSNDSHILPLAVSHKILQPLRSDDFRIIVQKQQEFSLCILCTKIIDRGIIKGAIPFNHLYF